MIASANGRLPVVKQTGRPTKLTPDRIDRLCGALADGMPIKGACVIAGIGVTTLAEWREHKPELETRLEEAREHARQKALQAIKSAGEKDWRAWAEWLRLVFAADYRGNASKIEVSATAQASSFPIMTEERQRQLQERTRKALESVGLVPKANPSTTEHQIQ